jgi:hypothetical protein
VKSPCRSLRATEGEGRIALERQDECPRPASERSRSSRGGLADDVDQLDPVVGVSGGVLEVLERGQQAGRPRQELADELEAVSKILGRDPEGMEGFPFGDSRVEKPLSSLPEPAADEARQRLVAPPGSGGRERTAQAGQLCVAEAEGGAEGRQETVSVARRVPCVLRRGGDAGGQPLSDAVPGGVAPEPRREARYADLESSVGGQEPPEVARGAAERLPRAAGRKAARQPGDGRRPAERDAEVVENLLVVEPLGPCEDRFDPRPLGRNGGGKMRGQRGSDGGTGHAPSYSPTAGAPPGGI